MSDVNKMPVIVVLRQKGVGRGEKASGRELCLRAHEILAGTPIPQLPSSATSGEPETSQGLSLPKCKVGFVRVPHARSCACYIVSAQ